MKTDIKVLIENRELFQTLLTKYNGEMAKYEEAINTAKKELKIAVKSKIKFLLGLLKAGVDCRSKGLTWIIRSLWNLGEKIYME